MSRIWWACRVVFRKILSNMSSIFHPFFTFYAVRLNDMRLCVCVCVSCFIAPGFVPSATALVLAMALLGLFS